MPGPAPRRLFLHVGLQKTGTSYLQGVMRRNATALAGQGLDLVPPTRREAFELMLQVRERYNPERDPASVADALTGFSEGLRKARGARALLSQESLAASRPRQIERLVAAAGDREVHVVLTVRDLARQLPSSWQQELKAGHAEGYRRYLRRLQARQRAGRTGHPWIQLDPVTVLARWSRAVPADRIHVVTVPPAGSPPDLLLRRFCQVLDVDPDGLVPSETVSNTSLGRVQAEVLRRVNARLPKELRRRQVYGDLGKRFFASQVLGAQEGRPIRVPADLRAWCDETADGQIRALRSAGYRVVGDLADLRCREGAFAADDKPGEGETAAAAVDALVRILSLRGETLRRRQARASRPRALAARVRRRFRRVPSAGWADVVDPGEES